MRIVFVLSLAALAASSLGCADECTSAGDCKGSQQCEEGSCVDPTTRPPLPVPFADAGMDATVVLPEFPDASDAADAADAGSSTVADTGVGDGDGGGPDGGVEAGVVERTGLIELATLVGSSTNTTRAVGEFIGFSPPTVRTPYSDAQSSCTIIGRVASGGHGVGIGGETITISGFVAGPSAQDIVLSTTPGTRGIFTSATPPTVTWSSIQMLRYAIAASTQSGSISAASTTLLGSMPPETSIVGPTLSMPLLLSQAGPWTFDANSLMAPLGLRAELTDGQRRVTLSCQPVNGARLQISAAARAAFTAAGAIGPYRLSVFYERRASLMVPLVGGGTIDTTVRQLSGLQYRVH